MNKKGKMTAKEMVDHNKNPNVLVKMKGKSFYCTVNNCGCNVFHHKDNWDIYICNGCGAEYIAK